MRLNQYLAQAGICSRRKADAFIKNGQIKVNNQIQKVVGLSINHSDVVHLKNRRVTPTSFVYFIMHKPVGCVTTTFDPGGRPTVLDFMGHHKGMRLYPIGRLDVNTAGALLMTNDGFMTYNLTHPKKEIPKIYHVTLHSPMKQQHFRILTTGVYLEDGSFKADYATYASSSKRHIRVTIHSGRNRILRRVFCQLGYHITMLKRISFAGISTRGIAAGSYRQLNHYELKHLKQINHQSKNDLND